MSFTGEVKSEIVNSDTIETEKISELSAIIHNADLSLMNIRISSENNNVIRYIFSLIKNLYKVSPKIIIIRIIYIFWKFIMMFIKY